MFPYLRRIAWISLTAALLGSVYSWLHYGNALSGAVVGAAGGAFLSGLEIFMQRGSAAPFLRTVPFLAFLSLRVAVYVVVLFAIFAATGRLFPGTFGTAPLGLADIAFSLAMCVAFNVLIGIDDLLGQGALVALVAGRYHRPQREERALLFVDMRNSTAAAERLGEERFLTLLNAFFADVTQTIAEHGGTIHKYVGDEAIATWPLRAGGKPPRCIEACLAAADRLVARSAAYIEEFGHVVEFRAALHGGTVVVGELGYAKREIALIGDAMNTTARLIEACRETGRPMLVSAELLSRLGPLPAGVAAEPLAPIALRGKAAPLAASALMRTIPRANAAIGSQSASIRGGAPSVRP
jgi:adenylate cyclase